MLPSYQEPGLQEFFHPAFADAGTSVQILREDMNHPWVSGNKWWKLRPYLEQAIATRRSILTFGGAWSNHLYSTAAGCAEAGIPCIGIVRGERPEILSSTLQFAERSGMRLEFVSRETYRNRNGSFIMDDLKQRFGDALVVPEGGSGPEAVQSCSLWAENIARQASFDVICLPVGTGGTFSGFMRGLRDDVRLLGFSVLKNGAFLEADIRRLSGIDRPNWEIITDFHFGGYGKVTPELLAFIQETYRTYGLPLDAVYTAKMFMGLITMAAAGKFERGTRILAIHTGGLQGNAGFPQLTGIG